MAVPSAEVLVRVGAPRSGTYSPARAARSRRRRTNLRGWLFISPWIIGFVVFTAYPFVASLFFSFTNYSVVSSPKWVGLQNYSTLLHTGLFWRSLYNTFYYAILEVPLSTILGIAIALLLNMKVKGIAIYRTIFFIPSIVPTVASSIVWLWLFNPSFGVINDVLSTAHLPTPGWIFSAAWSKPSFVLMGLWAVGAPIIIYLAGLQGVPRELYEAASLEGAGPWQRTRRVTLPLLSPVILFNVLIGLITSFQFFTQAFIMTSGGPNNSSEFYSLYLYQEAFEYLHMGYASAMAWMLFLVILVLTVGLFRLSNRWVFYS